MRFERMPCTNWMAVFVAVALCGTSCNWISQVNADDTSTCCMAGWKSIRTVVMCPRPCCDGYVIRQNILPALGLVTYCTLDTFSSSSPERIVIGPVDPASPLPLPLPLPPAIPMLTQQSQQQPRSRPRRLQQPLPESEEERVQIDQRLATKSHKFDARTQQCSCAGSGSSQSEN